MSRPLHATDLEAAVLGGMILGGGGGGHAHVGRSLGASALAAGTVALAEPAELAPDDLVAICAAVGAPGAPDQFVALEHYTVALQRLADEVERRGLGRLAAVATNENGALGTINGWLQAATLGLPLLDCPCNGRAHPTAVMGSLGLHRDAGYTAIAGYAGGRPERYLEGVVVGSLGQTAQAVREISILTGGFVAVARNPVRVDYLVRNGAPGGISAAIRLGTRHRSGGLEAVAAELSGRVVASGPVEGLSIEQIGGFDVGRLVVDGVAVTFANEYMAATRDGENLGAFPDLIMTFTGDGMPIVSADLHEGAPVQVLVAPRTSLTLSTTMAMPELMEPVEALLRGDPVTTGG